VSSQAVGKTGIREQEADEEGGLRERLLPADGTDVEEYGGSCDRSEDLEVWLLLFGCCCLPSIIS